MEGLLEAFIALFVVMDPIGILPLFIGLTRGMPSKEIKINANRSILVAGVVLFVFLFLGLQIFDFFGIDLNSFQIAGGIILLIMGIMYALGLTMKFLKSHGPDVSVPVGTPLLTGPGVIMTTIIIVKESGPLVTVIAAFITLFITWLVLINSSKMYKILGQHWIDVISRVMGIVLAALAVGFITKGIVNIVTTLI